MLIGGYREKFARVRKKKIVRSSSHCQERDRVVTMGLEKSSRASIAVGFAKDDVGILQYVSKIIPQLPHHSRTSVL